MYETSIAISTIKNYIDTYLFEPKSNWPEDEFAARSYSRWAADYILDRIISESQKPPYHITGIESKTFTHIVQECIDELDYCSEIRDGKFCKVFSIAKEVAIDIALLFL